MQHVFNLCEKLHHLKISRYMVVVPHNEIIFCCRHVCLVMVAVLDSTLDLI